MLVFYYVWYFVYLFLNYTHVFIENNFLIKNNPFLVRQRTFKYISYLEKLVLVLFYRKGWFEKSLANVLRKKDISEHRWKYYPIIHSFHVNHDKVDYEFENLKLIVKQYKYYLNNRFYKNKYLKILKLCFKIKNKIFIKFLILQKIFIKNYFNFNSFLYFSEKNNLNLVKLNRLFNIFLMRSSKKLIMFNLDIWYDWYNYAFGKNIVRYFIPGVKLSAGSKKKLEDFRLKRLITWINMVFKYKKRVVIFCLAFGKKFQGIIYFSLNVNNIFTIKIKKDFGRILEYYIIKFSESSISKYITAGSSKKYNIQYLRKNRIFNKGRYSRNRQLYRTGVYWCLWLNIIMVYGLYFMFYRFTFNFGYFWWGILFLCYSTIFSRVAKYNFYNINYLYKEFFSLVKWYGSVILSFYDFVFYFFKNYFFNANIFYYVSKYKNNTLNFFYDRYYYYLFKYVTEFIKNRKKIKMTFIWQGMKEKDTSFLRYKTIIHFLKETYRLIITKG